jgi:heme-degrading monooxygenase HmoA
VTQTEAQHAGAELPVDPTIVASLHLFGVHGIGVARAITHMGADRFRLRKTPGLRFAKLLGTGDGRTFTLRDADPKLWGVFTVWDSAAAADAFDQAHSVPRSWRKWADESAVIRLRPLRWKGEWAGSQPFGDAERRSSTADWAGPVAALTRARIKTGQLVSFARAVPPVAADARSAAGLRFSVGIGEAPVGLQATFSIWDSEQAIDQFAYRQSAHREVIRRTHTDGWYAEELFVRFGVESATGTVKGASMEELSVGGVSSRGRFP